jgi:uncharacterized protein
VRFGRDSSRLRKYGNDDVSSPLQEIPHRWVAINRRHDIQPAFDAILKVVDEVLPVDRAIVERAKRIVLSYQRLSACDAVDLAVMEHHSDDRILTSDAMFDGVPGITRLS